MNIFDKLDYNIGIVLDTINVSKTLRRIIRLEKTFFKENGLNQYFIKFYNLENDRLINIGYIYFYLDFQTRISTYIGSYVKPEYRSQGLASTLTSYWIKFCFDNGFYDLTTIKSQRKPFLLYILKTFSFDIENLNDYLSSNYNIHICMLPNDKTKYLVFENAKYALSFKEGKIYKNDNYQILDPNEEGLIKLDTVQLSKIHNLKNPEIAYEKSEKKIEQFKTK